LQRHQGWTCHARTAQKTIIGNAAKLNRILQPINDIHRKKPVKKTIGEGISLNISRLENGTVIADDLAFNGFALEASFAHEGD
jgi:hypothetical protein